MKMIFYILDLTVPKRIVQIEKKTKNLINNGTSSSVCLSIAVVRVTIVKKKEMEACMKCRHIRDSSERNTRKY